MTSVSIWLTDDESGWHAAGDSINMIASNMKSLQYHRILD